MHGERVKVVYTVGRGQKKIAQSVKVAAECRVWHDRFQQEDERGVGRAAHVEQRQLTQSASKCMSILHCPVFISLTHTPGLCYI